MVFHKTFLLMLFRDSVDFGAPEKVSPGLNVKNRDHAARLVCKGRRDINKNRNIEIII